MPGFIARRCLILDLDLGTRREPQVAVGDDRLADGKPFRHRRRSGIRRRRFDLAHFDRAIAGKLPLRSARAEASSCRACLPRQANWRERSSQGASSKQI